MPVTNCSRNPAESSPAKAANSSPAKAASGSVRNKNWISYQRVWLRQLRDQILESDEGSSEVDKEVAFHRQNRALSMSRLPGWGPRFTLVLDLDETLVHTKFEDGGSFSDSGWRTLLRPQVKRFLQTASHLFELVLFTSGLAEYASPIVDKLDPERKFFADRRFYRESCTHLRGIYVKDLCRLEGRDLRHLVIIDNSPESYLLQPENAMPICPFFGDANDRALPDVLRFLTVLAENDGDDVRFLLQQYTSGESSWRDTYRRLKSAPHLLSPNLEQLPHMRQRTKAKQIFKESSEQQSIQTLDLELGSDATDRQHATTLATSTRNNICAFIRIGSDPDWLPPFGDQGGVVRMSPPPCPSTARTKTRSPDKQNTDGDKQTSAEPSPEKPDKCDGSSGASLPAQSESSSMSPASHSSGETMSPACESTFEVLASAGDDPHVDYRSGLLRQRAMSG